MMEIRGQQATDWQDIYEMRLATPGTLPYLQPDQVREELARPQDRTWPIVAVLKTSHGPKVVARVNLRLGWGRRGHSASLTLERHPDHGDEPGRMLLQEAINLAENWWNRHRLEVVLPTSDTATLGVLESFDFSQEARLRQNVRVAGKLVDEVVLARITGEMAATRRPMPPAARSDRRPRSRFEVAVRIGSTEEWEAYHTIWSQPSVIWGTMQIPYPSADWNRKRVQQWRPARLWPLVAEVDGKVVGTSGLVPEEHNHSHVGRVGMMIHADYQGMGIGSALLEAAMDLAENWLGLTRIQLEVYTDNAPAITLYEKSGFEKEGLHRAFAYRDGEYVDALVMGRLKGR